jgi:NhaP-type Na+/H+ and K+/H+ antiporter
MISPWSGRRLTAIGSKDPLAMFLTIMLLRQVAANFH